MSLALALIVVTIAMGFAAVVAGTAFANLHLIGEMPQQLNVRCLADSLVALGIEQVQSSKGTFGQNAADGLYVYWSQGAASGSMSFTSGTAASWTGTAPWSTNNVKGDHADAWQRKIPQGAVHLVGLALTSDGYAHASEALVYQWPYPYAICSNGPIVSNLGLVVGAVQSSQYLDTDLSKVPASQQAPGNIASNSPDNFFALSAGATCHITGDAQAVGGIAVPPASVDGAVQSYAAPVPLPSMDITQQKPDPSKLMANLCAVEKQDLPLEGYCEAPKGLVETGNVILNQAVLYVDGDMVVNGSVYGQGAVFATGSITINGGATASNIKADSYCAMAANGDIKLLGNSRSSNFFGGIIYCQGQFVCQHVTLDGSCVNNSSNPNIGISLTDAALVAVPEYTHVKFQVPLPPPPPPPPSGSYPISGVSASGATTTLATVTSNPDGTVSVTAPDPTTGLPTTTTYTTTTNPSTGVTTTATQQAGNQVQSLYNTSTGTDNMTAADQTAVGQPFPGPPTPAEAATIVAIHAASGSSSSGGSSVGPSYGGSGGGTETFEMNYNTFIGFGDQMRVLMWRDLGGRWHD
jgi:hypothetical protein